LNPCDPIQLLAIKDIHDTLAADDVHMIAPDVDEYVVRIAADFGICRHGAILHRVARNPSGSPENRKHRLAFILKRQRVVRRPIPGRP
jgi:hypothetical protein